MRIGAGGPLVEARYVGKASANVMLEAMGDNPMSKGMASAIGVNNHEGTGSLEGPL